MLKENLVLMKNFMALSTVSIHVHIHVNTHFMVVNNPTCPVDLYSGEKKICFDEVCLFDRRLSDVDLKRFPYSPYLTGVRLLETSSHYFATEINDINAHFKLHSH